MAEASAYEINTTPENRWEEYKRLRMEALQSEPQAFVAANYDMHLQEDEEWKNHLITKDEADYRLSLEIDKKIVGIICSNKSELNLSVAMIYSLYVTPQYRGRGYGLALIKNLLSRLDNIPTIQTMELSVTTSQIAAIKSFQACGFKTVAMTNCQLYNNPGKFCDALIMERPNSLLQTIKSS